MRNNQMNVFRDFVADVCNNNFFTGFFERRFWI